MGKMPSSDPLVQVGESPHDCFSRAETVSGVGALTNSHTGAEFYRERKKRQLWWKIGLLNTSCRT